MGIGEGGNIPSGRGGSEAPLSDVTNQHTVKANRINYKIDIEDHIGSGGLKTKFKDNISAIRLLKELENKVRLADPEEQKILAKYTGWGGMPQVFSYKEDAGDWSKERDELKVMLTLDEYISARASTMNAHYTSTEVIAAMYSAIKRMGFDGGNVLEPSMGIGNFFGLFPGEFSGSKLYGVELDSLTGRIAKQLYQDADISIQGFEETNLPDNFFDVVISNIPFGEYKLNDPKYNSFNLLIHDYFFIKSLDNAKPGGLIAFITSKGTLDKANSSIRKYIAARAELVGAIRLPNTASKANANTEVTTDVIFLKKKDRILEDNPDWVYTGYTEDNVPINEYYLNNPQMLLGRMIFDESMYGNEKSTSLISDGRDIAEALNSAVHFLPAEIYHREVIEISQNASKSDVIPADINVRILPLRC